MGIELGITIWSKTPSTKYMSLSQLIKYSLNIKRSLPSDGFKYLGLVDDSIALDTK